MNTKPALVCYGMGIATAIAGWYHPNIAGFGMLVLVVISIVLSIYGG